MKRIEFWDKIWKEFGKQYGYFAKRKIDKVNGIQEKEDGILVHCTDLDFPQGRLVKFTENFTKGDYYLSKELGYWVSHTDKTFPIYYVYYTYEGTEEDVEIFTRSTEVLRKIKRLEIIEDRGQDILDKSLRNIASEEKAIVRGYPNNLIEISCTYDQYKEDYLLKIEGRLYTKDDGLLVLEKRQNSAEKELGQKRERLNSIKERGETRCHDY